MYFSCVPSRARALTCAGDRIHKSEIWEFGRREAHISEHAAPSCAPQRRAGAGYRSALLCKTHTHVAPSPLLRLTTQNAGEDRCGALDAGITPQNVEHDNVFRSRFILFSSALLGKIARFAKRTRDAQRGGRHRLTRRLLSAALGGACQGRCPRHPCQRT